MTHLKAVFEEYTLIPAAKEEVEEKEGEVKEKEEMEDEQREKMGRGMVDKSTSKIVM